MGRRDAGKDLSTFSAHTGESDSRHRRRQRGARVARCAIEPPRRRIRSV